MSTTLMEGALLTLLGTLISVIGYFAIDVHARLSQIAQSLQAIELAWTNKLSLMNSRVTILETRMALYHGDHVHPPEIDELKGL